MAPDTPMTQSDPADQASIARPPVGLAALLLLGPSLIWCAEYIGSGEVILATRSGAILGTGILWVIISGIFLKFWIGMAGARYTVCTGEGMIDMIARVPGPAHWGVWIVLVAQVAAGAISIGSLATAAGVFVSSLLPVSAGVGGLAVTLFAVAVAWSGTFEILKVVMSALVFVTVIGVLWVAITVLPEAAALFEGLALHVPTVPDWATRAGVDANPWREILPLLGWAAGGFASQVWYTYWVLGAGYGAAAGARQGEPADTERLKRLTREDGMRLRRWCRVVQTDASLAMLIGILVTACFLIAGAGVLGPRQVAPEGPEVALTLSTLFSETWGELGGFLFLLGGTAALISTQIGQLAGWPRLLTDAFRICLPSLGRNLSWKKRYRFFLLFFVMTNAVIVFALNEKPVLLVQISALFDGLLLTPLQALWVGIGLFYILPRLLSDEARELLRPHWIYGAVLAIAFVVFGYFCVIQIPHVF